MILITRPAHQARLLFERIEAQGGQCFLFPAIEIADVADKKIVQDSIQTLFQQDIAIFISPNAVQKAAALIETWPEPCKIAAIGEGTAQAVRALNWPVNFVPEKQFNTEALLMLPAFQAVTDKNIILFKGEGGRELLVTTLRDHGANVTEVIVYRRVLPKPEMIPDLNKINLIVCTSHLALQNISLLFEKNKDQLFNKQLLVSSERIVDFAKQLGFVKSPLIAENASDDAIMKVLENYI